MLNIEWFESLLEDLAELDSDLGVKGADRAYIIVREIFELCSRFYPAVRFPTFFIVHIIAHRTDIPGRPPFVKSPFADPSLSIPSADRADIVIRKILKCRTCWNTIMGFATEGRINVPTERAAVSGHVL